jgi:hypothetical protein
VKHRYRGAIVGVSLALVVAILFNGFAFYVVFNQRRVADQLRVWNFRVTAALAEQIHRDQLTDEGEFLYLASHPKVESQRDFNQTCSAVTADTSILGCYIESSKRIYLYHETDPRLDGTEEVMGAHEMLRAAWDRTSAPQRKILLVELDRVLAINHDRDLDLSGRMTAIRRDDPTDANAELYALVGTEIPSVGKVLERDYAQYFANRSVVTKLSAHSRAFVIALAKMVAALSTTLDALNTTIDAQVTAFNAAVATLDADVASFNARAVRPGGFSSQRQFNVARQALVNRQTALQATADQINGQIDVFNGDLTKLEALSKTAASLVKGLNIELDPLPNIIST